MAMPGGVVEATEMQATKRRPHPLRCKRQFFFLPFDGERLEVRDPRRRTTDSVGICVNLAIPREPICHPNVCIL